MTLRVAKYTGLPQRPADAVRVVHLAFGVVLVLNLFAVLSSPPSPPLFLCAASLVMLRFQYSTEARLLLAIHPVHQQHERGDKRK